MSDSAAPDLVPVPYEYRSSFSTLLAARGNQLVAMAWTWHQGGLTDQQFENGLFLAQLELIKLWQLYHNERLISSMQRGLVNEAEQLLTKSDDRPTLPPVDPTQERQDPDAPTQK